MLIFIVYYNSEKEGSLLYEHVKALKNLDYPDYEVIMVDNASSDNTFKILSNLISSDSRFKLIRSEKIPISTVEII
ncbi:glycosyltransferase [Stygiolobus sp. CP8521M]|uniref:glycosyltransferase n=1 Tax=Stygiolobus sp. CP8521M TaxID=3133136 RepID=UPI003FD155C9